MSKSPNTPPTSAGALNRNLRIQSRSRRETLVEVQVAAAGQRRNGDPGLDLQIERLSIADLKPAGRRVKKADPGQVARIRASIQRFGIVTPVLVDAAGGIIHGHVVVDAARSLDLTHIDCVRLEHLSAEEARLLSISLNRLAETGDWDFGALKLEFQDLVVLDEPLTITGFDEPVLDALLAEPADGIDPEADRLPALGLEAVARPGDIFRLGEHLRACGDARAVELIRRLLGDELARLGFIDPPYNSVIQNNVTTKAHREFAMASGEMTDEAFIAFLTEAFAALSAALVLGGLLLSFMDWRGLYPMMTAARALGLEDLNLIVWAKTNAGMGSLWRSQHELIGAYKKPGAAHTNNVQLGKSGRWRSNLWRYPGASSLGSDARDGLAGHPTPKPVALLADGILDVTHRGDIVMDTFAGSGSTLMACEQTGRRFRGVEIDPLYVDLIIRRWQAKTGRAATLEGSNLTFEALDLQRAATGSTDDRSPHLGALAAGSSRGAN